MGTKGSGHPEDGAREGGRSPQVGQAEDTGREASTGLEHTACEGRPQGGGAQLEGLCPGRGPAECTAPVTAPDTQHQQAGGPTQLGRRHGPRSWAPLRRARARGGRKDQREQMLTRAGGPGDSTCRMSPGDPVQGVEAGAHGEGATRAGGQSRRA